MDRFPRTPGKRDKSSAAFRQMLADIRDAVQQAVTRGATEDRAVATIRWPQYEKMQGYDAEREGAVPSGHSRGRIIMFYRRSVSVIALMGALYLTIVGAQLALQKPS
jgi:hypothetical protein